MKGLDWMMNPILPSPTEKEEQENQSAITELQNKEVHWLMM